MWKDSLVIGKALDPHTFEVGGTDKGVGVELTGLTSPWNTFVSWLRGKKPTVNSWLEPRNRQFGTFANWPRYGPPLPFPIFLLNLAQTGFLPISDTNTTPGQSAIEEVPTIALHQLLFPSSSRAVLVKFPSEGGWDTKWYVLYHIPFSYLMYLMVFLGG